MLPTISIEDRPRRPRQLWLFPVAKPLTERLGRSFFARIPREPGVYFMYDHAGKLLYIGQSQDLRERLNSYRQVHPDRDRRRLVRLVHSVDRIEWKICPSAEDAICTEKELLLALRPRFNRASVWPAPQWFIELRTSDSRLELGLLKNAEVAAGRYGPFKGGCRPAFASLARLIYLAMVRPVRWEQFPFCLLNGPPRQGWSIPTHTSQPALICALEDCLAGRNNQLLSLLEQVVLSASTLSPFEKAYWEGELNTVKEFFDPADEPQAGDYAPSPSTSESLR